MIKPAQNENTVSAEPGSPGASVTDVAMETDSDGHPVVHCEDNKPRPGL